MKELEKYNASKRLEQNMKAKKKINSKLEMNMEADKIMDPTIEVTKRSNGDDVEELEHGTLPSTKEVNEVKHTEHIPTCLSYEMVQILYVYEIYLAHLSESELSDSTIISEIACLQSEDISDTPSELRVLVHR
jgi:hypothetical protein